MNLLITVGTYKFDELINLIDENIKLLIKLYEKIDIQIGDSKNQFIKIKNVNIYRYITEEMYNDYDVIVCHGGTGTILNCLLKNKIVVAVSNEKLKDNHQNETLEVFKNYIIISDLKNLITILKNKNFEKKEKLVLKNNSNFFKRVL
ncbi:hypothetical protein GVAV_001992 [Gurleya vavrai]